MVLTERDLELLYAVGRMRAAITSQLCVYFGDRSVASRRLRALFAAKLLHVTVPALNGENVYVLTKRGGDALLDAGFETADLHVGPPPSRDADLRHLLEINWVRVAVLRAVKRMGSATVTLFRADLDLRRALGVGRATILPDALVEVVVPAGPIRLVVEVDLGTETGRVLAAKAAAIRDILIQGAPCYDLAAPWTPLLLAPSERRLQSLAVALHGLLPDRWRAGTLDLLRGDDLLTAPLRSLQDVGRRIHAGRPLLPQLLPLPPAPAARAATRTGSAFRSTASNGGSSAPLDFVQEGSAGLVAGGEDG
ncbi:MAG: replication-relaxation family protein [Myxococcota bacterium]